MTNSNPNYEPAEGTGLTAIREIVSHSDALIEGLRNQAFDPESSKMLKRLYTITQVSKLIGRSATAIRKAEADGHLPKPATNEKGRRTGYSLVEVNRIRDHFGIKPGRADSEETVRLAFQNFKGGVGKSTLSTHFSQYMAERGYRVLVVDCDSQASTTTTFGFRPDQDLEADDTLLPFVMGEKSDLAYAIKPTYWDRLDIIPANLGLYNAEYEIAATAGTGGAAWIDHLNLGLETIEQDYDLIVMDAPPALGMISLNVVRAANALLVPSSPAMYDFHSTVTFFRMMEEVLSSVEKAVGEPLNYKFLKLCVSKYNTGKGMQEFMVKMMAEHYSKYVLQSSVKDSAEIDNAGADWRTIYELERPSGSAQTYKRCLASLKSVFSEIEILIRQTWPSHKAKLEAEGVGMW